MKSNFESDLLLEQKLSRYLDLQYPKLLPDYLVERIQDRKQQHLGVDLVLTHKKTPKKYYADEKAQLDYLNKKLPTFAFELFYEKYGKQKTGWFLDTQKKTDLYLLVTGIWTDVHGDFNSCHITQVNKAKLLECLSKRELTSKRLRQLADSQPTFHGKMQLANLNPRTEGYLFFSRKNKVEKPVNLILRLEFLCRTGVAKPLV
ncbi:hypothetical protein [Flagellimonas flava]|uniref:Uncharacterized protein n=1 Tax=Flagellimonas flava TaxID=570519 RepID=A0A1M5KYQ8_9FLAO|nr:hypothetical protein [Allomuricauda flava]SHG57855.1 hypothetical protein SAMN04488116_1857 [Allomuricauda flava]